MTPLHWAAVKGSKPAIRYLVEAGADLEAKEEQGKTPRDMAEELKSIAPFEKGLEEAGWTGDGRKKEGRLSEVSVVIDWKEEVEGGADEIAVYPDCHSKLTDAGTWSDIQNF